MASPPSGTSSNTICSAATSASLSADYADLRRLFSGWAVLFYPQITQINADYFQGGLFGVGKVFCRRICLIRLIRPIRQMILLIRPIKQTDLPDPPDPSDPSDPPDDSPDPSDPPADYFQGGLLGVGRAWVSALLIPLIFCGMSRRCATIHTAGCVVSHAKARRRSHESRRSVAVRLRAAIRKVRVCVSSLPRRSSRLPVVLRACSPQRDMTPQAQTKRTVSRNVHHSATGRV